MYMHCEEGFGVSLSGWNEYDVIVISMETMLLPAKASSGQWAVGKLAWSYLGRNVFIYLNCFPLLFYSLNKIQYFIKQISI